jgi:hypothetical protein
MSALADNGGLRPQQEPLGTLLVRRGLITPEQLTVALAEQKTAGKPLGAVVVELGFAAPASIAQALATQHGGVLKTEYGFATGFGAGARPPEILSAPPLSAPRLTSVDSSASAVPTLRVDPNSATPRAAEVDREAVRSELELASHETERLADANGRLAEVRAELEQRLATERQRVSTLEGAAAAHETQISELTEGAVAWQAAYSELEHRFAQETDRAESLQAELKATEGLRAAADASERARAELEARLAPLEAELAERSDDLAQVRDVLTSYWEGAKKHLVLFQDAGGYEPVEHDVPPPAPSEPSYY